MSEVALARESAAGSIAAKPKIAFRKLAFAALALAAAFGAVRYGYSWWTVGRFLESTDDAYAGGNITPISPQVAGFVAEILIKDNQFVRAGELLIRLDSRTFQAALDHSSAVLQQQEATLENLRAKYTLQQSAIHQASADLTGKIAEASFAKEDAERYAILAATGLAGSRQNAQRTNAADLSAQAAVASGEAKLAAARQQLAVLDTEIAQTSAAIAAAKADVETARLNLGYTEIRSPIDGYIGNRAAQLGAYVSIGTYLVTVIPAQGLWVDANFKEDQLARMRPGQPATVVADINPDKPIEGRVGSLAPATGTTFSIIPAENATGNFTKIVQRVPVRIEFDAGEAKAAALRPGVSATVTVDTRSERKTD
ncbi:MAG: HlyD family secretion protein [Rhodomicrobium sp.]